MTPASPMALVRTASDRPTVDYVVVNAGLAGCSTDDPYSGRSGDMVCRDRRNEEEG